MVGEAAWCRGCYWLRDGQWHGGAKQFEGAPLDRRGRGELVDGPAVEGDGLPVEGGEVGEQVAVAVDGQAVVVALGAVVGLGLVLPLGGGERLSVLGDVLVGEGELG